MPETAKDRDEAVELSITLKGLAQPVWRQVRVPADIDLAALHGVIQAAMGWEDRHLHRFEIGGEPYGGDAEGHDEEEVQLADVAARGDRFTYLYDFGDGWEHELRVEATGGAPGPVYLCLAGEGACPPEDSGGVPGYEEILAARDGGRRIARELEDLLALLGDFDPAEFDLAEANERIAMVVAGAGDDVLWTDDDAIEEDVAPPGPGEPHHRGGQVKA